MSIADELREWASVEVPYKYGHQLLAIANRIDAEHEAQLNDAFETRNSDENLENDGWVRLPKDADGEYIHIGDVMDYLEALHSDVPARFKVQDMFYYGNGKWHLRAYPATYEPEKCRHYHAPTVEDVLTEFGIDWEHESDCEDRAALLKEYAKRLKLAEEGE